MLAHIGCGSPESIDFSKVDAGVKASGNIFTRGGIRRTAHVERYTEKMETLPQKVFREDRDMTFPQMHAELVKLRLQITNDPSLNRASRKQLLHKLQQTETRFVNDTEIAGVRLDALAKPYCERLRILASQISERTPSSPPFRELQAQLADILNDIETDKQLNGSDQSTALFEIVATVQRELLNRSSENYAPVAAGLSEIHMAALTGTEDGSKTTQAFLEETSLLELQNTKGRLEAAFQSLVKRVDTDELADADLYLLHHDTTQTQGLVEALDRAITAKGILAHAGTPASTLAQAEAELRELSENVSIFTTDQNARPPFVFDDKTMGSPIHCGNAIGVAETAVVMVAARLESIELSNRLEIKQDMEGVRESLSAPATTSGSIDSRLSHLGIIQTRIKTVAALIDHGLLSENRALLGGELALLSSQVDSGIETLRCEQILTQVGRPGTTLSALARELSAMGQPPTTRSAMARLSQTSSNNLKSIRGDLQGIENEFKTASPQRFPFLRAQLDVIALRGEKNLLSAHGEGLQTDLSQARADFLPKLRAAVLHENIPALDGMLDRLSDASRQEFDTLSETGYLLNPAFANRLQELVTAGPETLEAVTGKADEFFEAMGAARSLKESLAGDRPHPSDEAHDADETIFQKALTFVDTMTRDHGHLDGLALGLKRELVPAESHDHVTLRHHANIAKREFGHALRQASGFGSETTGFDMPIQEITFDTPFLHSIITNPDARLDEVNVMFARAYMLDAIADGRLNPEEASSREAFAKALSTAGFPASFEVLDQMIKLDFRSTADAARVSADIEKFSRTISTNGEALKSFMHVCYGAQRFKAREAINILAQNMLKTFSISGEQAVEDGLLGKRFDQRLGIGKDPRYKSLTRNLNTYLKQDDITRGKFTELMSLYTQIDEAQQPHIQDLLRRSGDLMGVTQEGVPANGTIPQASLKGSTLCKSLLEICQTLDDSSGRSGLQALRMTTALSGLQNNISLEEMRGSTFSPRTQGETTRDFTRLASTLKKRDLPSGAYQKAWSDMRRVLEGNRTRQKAEAVMYFKGHETSDCRFSWIQGHGATLVNQAQKIAQKISDLEQRLDKETTKNLRTLGWSIPRVIDDAVHIAVLNQFLKSGCETLSDFKSRFVLSSSGALSPSPDYQEIRKSLESMNIPFEVLAENRLTLFVQTMEDSTIDTLRGGVKLDRSLGRRAEALYDELSDEIKQDMWNSQWERAASAGISRLSPGKKMSISLGRQISISTDEIPIGLGDAKVTLAFKAARNQSVSVLQAEDGGYQVILKGGVSAGATASLDGLLDRIAIEAGVSGGIDRGCIIKFDAADQCRQFVAKLVGGQAGFDSLGGSSGISFVRDGNIEAAVKISVDPIEKSVPPIAGIGLENGIALTAELTLGAGSQWHEERSASTVTRTHEVSYSAELKLQVGTRETSLAAKVTKGSTLVYRSGALTTESSVSRTAPLESHPGAAAFAFLRQNGVDLPQSHPYMLAIMESAQAVGSGAKIVVSRTLTEDAMFRYNEAVSDKDRSAVLSDSSNFMLGGVKITGSQTESAFESTINLALLKYSRTVHSDLETVVSFDLREFAHHG
ncbi:MAG: hypothetical protein JEZ12_20905 [Desulfobacterium sp.]|nr:hypothetical protein [Desulfobacterium sp.]